MPLVGVSSRFAEAPTNCPSHQVTVIPYPNHNVRKITCSLATVSLMSIHPSSLVYPSSFLTSMLSSSRREVPWTPRLPPSPLLLLLPPRPLPPRPRSRPVCYQYINNSSLMDDLCFREAGFETTLPVYQGCSLAKCDCALLVLIDTAQKGAQPTHFSLAWVQCNRRCLMCNKGTGSLHLHLVSCQYPV